MNLTIEDDKQIEVKHDALMMEVIKSGNIDALERFIALREREEARQAAKEFDAHFSEMQSEFPVIEKRKSAKDYEGREMYKYAPLEDLQKAVGSIVSRHGFSITFSEETIPEGKRIFMRISGHGSSRTNSVDIMALSTNKRTNATQAGVGTSSYGMRAAYKAGLGLTIAGEDDDGIGDDDPADYAQDIQQLKNAESMDALGIIWGPIYKAHQGNKKALAILTAVKDEQKGRLSK